MNVFKVSLNEHNAEGLRSWINLECGLEDLAEVSQRLSQDGHLVGNQLFVSKLREGVLEIRHSRPVIIMASSIWTVDVPEIDFVRYLT